MEVFFSPRPQRRPDSHRKQRNQMMTSTLFLQHHRRHHFWLGLVYRRAQRDYPPLASLGAHFKSVSLLEKVNLDFTRQSRPLKEIINEDPPLTLPPRHLTAPAAAERETVDGAAVPSIADDARKSIIETQSEFVGRFRTLGHQ